MTDKSVDDTPHGTPSGPSTTEALDRQALGLAVRALGALVAQPLLVPADSAEPDLPR